MKPVAILGSGPAGLLAAHAVALRGQPFAIFSEGKPSKIGGAQFLHSAIPNLTAEQPDFHVIFKLKGEASEYRRKVYGDAPGVPFVSMEGLTDGQVQPAWDLRTAYEQLFDGPMGRSVEGNKVTVSAKWLWDHQFDFSSIISSIPLNVLCLNPQHVFSFQTILISTDDISFVGVNEIVYNGEPSPSWYRASNINGHCGTEWSTNTPKPPLPNLIQVKKPVWTNCDCYPQMIRVGRYGEWKKGVLVDDAFKKVMAL